MGSGIVIVTVAHPCWARPGRHASIIEEGGPLFGTRARLPRSLELRTGSCEPQARGRHSFVVYSVKGLLQGIYSRVLYQGP